MMPLVVFWWQILDAVQDMEDEANVPNQRQEAAADVARR